jgi:hypothetical protein
METPAIFRASGFPLHKKNAADLSDDFRLIRGVLLFFPAQLKN